MKISVYSIKQIYIFVVLPCAVHDSLTVAICSFAPHPFLNPACSIGISSPMYMSQVVFE